MAALWKLDVPLDPTFSRINSSFREDWFLFPHEISLQRAHALALEACGILSAGERCAVEAALEQLTRRFAQAVCPDSDAEDIHTWIETALIEAVGDTGKKLHAGRSRNDQVATLILLSLIAEGEKLEKRLATFLRLCGRKALKWRETVFPLQTHAQFAMPGTVGFWIMRYAASLHRIRGHAVYLTRAWRMYCPLGSGAVGGTSIPIDRRVQARELGFLGPSPNALTSTSTRDECIEFLSLAAQISLHLQAFASDIIAFSQTPLGWTEYPRAFGTGSSMMPQKINPDAMELLRGECCAVIAALPEAILLCKGLPSGYNRDLQCIKPIVRRTAEKLDALLAMATAFLEQLEFNANRLKESLCMGNIDATLRMERMVMQGVPLRQAHHAVAENLHASNEPPNADALDCTAYQTTGSAHPEETRHAAEALLASLESDS